MSEHEFYIAGVQHHQLRSCIDELKVGDYLSLVLEPTNKFDPNAVRIEHEGVMCGYVPRKLSAEVSAAIIVGNFGDFPGCEITHIDKSAKTWEMCKVKVKS